MSSTCRVQMVGILNVSEKPWMVTTWWEFRLFRESLEQENVRRFGKNPAGRKHMPVREKSCREKVSAVSGKILPGESMCRFRKDPAGKACTR